MIQFLFHLFRRLVQLLLPLVQGYYPHLRQFGNVIPVFGRFLLRVVALRQCWDPLFERSQQNSEVVGLHLTQQVQYVP